MPAGGYDAFISYNHEADGPVGPALRDGLHLFARPWNRLRALRVFCDTRAMDPADGLWTTIRRALDASRYLIVVASPGAAGSRWVGREIEHWRRTAPRRPILIVRTGGTIVWDAAAGDFNWDATTALPRALSGWFTEEPHWVDLEVPRDQLTLRSPVFVDATATLAAPLHGRAKDDLLGTDVLQHRRGQRFRRAMWAGLSLVTLLAVAAAAWAFTERSSAVAQRNAALAGSLVSEASTVRDTQPGLARQLVAAAYRLAPTPQARSAVVAGDEIPREITAQASALAYDADGALFAVVRSGRAEAPLYPEIVSHVWLHDAETLEVLSHWSLDSHEEIPAVTFADGGLLVVAHGSQVVVTDVTDPRRPAERVRLSAPSTLGNVLDVAPDGRTLAAGSDDGTLRLWDLAEPTDEPLSVSHPCTADDGVHQARFVRSGELLAVGCSLGPDATLTLWDVADPRTVVGVGEPVEKVRNFDVAPDGRRLVVETDGTLVRWDVTPSGRLEQARPLPLPPGYEGFVSVLTYGDEGKVAAVGDDGYARVWDADDDPALLVELPLPEFESANAEALVLAPGAGALAVASPGSDAGAAVDPSDGTIRIWHLADPLERRARASVPASDAELAVSADGRTLAGLVDGALYVADTSDPLRPEPLAHEPVDIEAEADEDTFSGEVVTALSPDGRTLAVASEGAVDVFDLTDREHPRHVAVWEGGIPLSVSFRADGGLLAVGMYDAEVQLYDLADPERPQPAGRVPTSGSSLVFLPDRPVLAVTGLFSSVIELWDLSSYVLPQKLSDDASHTYQIMEIGVTGNGMLASVARDSSVRTWRVEGDELVQRSVVSDSGDVNALAISADGGRMATLGRDETLRVYTLDDDVPALDLSVSVGAAAAGLVGFVGEDVLAVRTEHGAVDLWDLDVSAGLDRVCTGTGRTITEQQWDRVLPDVPYDPPC